MNGNIDRNIIKGCWPGLFDGKLSTRKVQGKIKIYLFYGIHALFLVEIVI